ncbi:MAG TPA: hypothetical protein VGG22_10200 [Candidatus Baltobacteraceae bacterium]|jgi:hypothetical protein
MTDEKLHYTLLRYVPDSLRGEVFNVGLVGVYSGRLYIRSFTEPSPLMRSLLPRAIIDRLQSFESALMKRFSKTFPSLDENGDVRTDGWPSAGFLTYLNQEGFAGFVIDEPQWVKVANGDDSAYTFDALFARLVEPHKVQQIGRHSRGQRARTIVRRVFDENDIDPNRVPRDVRIPVPYSKKPRDFGFAWANGQITLGQVVDFNVQEELQKQHADSAIALTVEMQHVLQEEKPCINIIAASNLDNVNVEHVKRLEQVGQTLILPRDEKELVALAREQAHTDVFEALSKRGIIVKVETTPLQETVPILAESKKKQ